MIGSAHRYRPGSRLLKPVQAVRERWSPRRKINLVRIEKGSTWQDSEGQLWHVSQRLRGDMYVLAPTWLDTSTETPDRRVSHDELLDRWQLIEIPSESRDRRSRQRLITCERGRHEDPDDTGKCIHCSMSLSRDEEGWSLERQVTIEELETLAKETAALAVPVFEAQQWTWWDVPGVPDEAKIEMTILRLLLECPLQGLRGSGGLLVTREIADDHETFEVKLDLGRLIAEAPFPFPSA